jgi:hypothetical protein
MSSVYFVKSGEDNYKVGVSASARFRVRELQTGNPAKIHVVSIVMTPNPYVLEKHVHEFLSAHRTDGGTEWFKLNPEQALEALAVLNSDVERAPHPGPIPASKYGPGAAALFRDYGRVSVSLLQRKLCVGYAKASRIVDELIASGDVIDDPDPTKRRLAD